MAYKPGGRNLEGQHRILPQQRIIFKRKMSEKGQSGETERKAEKESLHIGLFLSISW